MTLYSFENSLSQLFASSLVLAIVMENLLLVFLTTPIGTHLPETPQISLTPLESLLISIFVFFIFVFLFEMTF